MDIEIHSVDEGLENDEPSGWALRVDGESTELSCGDLAAIIAAFIQSSMTEVITNLKEDAKNVRSHEVEGDSEDVPETSEGS